MNERGEGEGQQRATKDALARTGAAMSFYEHWVLPPLLDLVMRQHQLWKYRREVVAGVRGRVLDHQTTGAAAQSHLKSPFESTTTLRIALKSHACRLHRTNNAVFTKGVRFSDSCFSCEGLRDVGDEIVRMLDPDRHANQGRRDSDLGELSR
jgi:hypothetical protein